ncbi:pyocin knob domain-containing protein [Enterococcus faecalis]|uniref:pyocin knob domain-containing protein n=1 Tax=Enterococcus faecalis TaxID=1351 RepID=UPI0021C69E1C|nr:pyocin knob domain-containing protein [Enterococcus faecalis]MCU2268587.1 pyocin knob domain-containing protein [Enterococcus faecalis]
MYTFKKGDADYQVMLNENFSEITDALENGALVSKKTVIKAQDWDEILDKGIYTVFGASGANRPYAGAVYGVLIVYADNTFICQNYIYKGETYTRSRQGSPATWTSWNRSVIEPQRTPLWTGAWYGASAGNGQVPSKPLSQCQNGWILQWQEYTKEGTLNGACYHFFVIPKQHAQNPGSKGVIFLLHGYYTNLVRKYLYITDTKITGNDMNALDSDTAGSGSKMFALSAIYEW